MSRKALIPLNRAQKLYGVEKTTFIRPRYVPENSCEWCGSPLPNKRRKSCCSEECNREFLNATCAVMYANSGIAIKNGIGNMELSIKALKPESEEK